MKPKRPYLLRALYEWIVDCDMTPYVLVQVDGPDVVVPQDFVEDDRIVLNISPMAVRALSLENDVVSFSGRFSGQPFNVVAPMRSISAIYAKETGEGMMFEDELVASASTEPAETAEGKAPESDDPSSSKSGSHLKVIK